MSALRKYLYSVICVVIVFACAYTATQTVDHPNGQMVGITCLGVSLLSIGTCISARWIQIKFERNLLLARREANKAKLKLGDRMGEAELFSKVSELIGSFAETRELEAVLRGTAEIIKGILNVEVAVLQVYSDEQSKFFMKAEAGGRDIRLCDSAVEDVLEKGMSRLINNLSAYPRYSEMADDGYTSMLVAPLVQKNRPVGFLGVLSTSGRNFTDRELRILSTFSKQASLIIENAQLLEKTRALAIRDGLTSLFNHRHFQQTLKEQIDAVKGNKTHLSLIMGDIDDFKKYNDANGHPMGDIALRTVGRILIDNTRGSDVVARYGGEEFVIILPGTSLEGAYRVADKTRADIAAYRFRGQEDLPSENLTISFGIGTFPEDAEKAGELIEKADKAMYEAKRRGKNSVVKWEEIAGVTKVSKT